MEALMANDRPTITTVAERARVSRQTMSNVLNAPHRVQPETQQRVRAASRNSAIGRIAPPASCAPTGPT